MIQTLLHEVQKLHHRHELAGTVGPDYYEPGMMEYLAQSDGSYDPETGHLMMQFEAKGTRYEGRTEQIEKVRVGDAISVMLSLRCSMPVSWYLSTLRSASWSRSPSEAVMPSRPFCSCGLRRVSKIAVPYDRYALFPLNIVKHPICQIVYHTL